MNGPHGIDSSAFLRDLGSGGWERLLVGLHNSFLHHLNLLFSYLMQWSQKEDCNCGARAGMIPKQETVTILGGM